MSKKQQTKKVSVIVPFYNAEKYLERCISSLINQKYKDYEIILVDDGSTDNSKKICQKYVSDTVVYKYKENGGVSSARNLGIKFAKNDYILFVDSDDTIDEDALLKLTQNIRTGKLVGLKRKTSKNGKKSKIKLSEGCFETNEYIKNILNNRINGFCFGFLFEKKCVDNFDEDSFYMEDTLFLINYLKSINEICFVDSYYNYYLNDDSVTLCKSIEKIQNNIVNINYTTNKMFESVDSLFFKTDEFLLNMKKMKLIESECCKLNSGKMICSLMINEQTRTIIVKLYLKSKKTKYYIFYNLLVNGRKNGLNMYLIIRKILKKLKRR